MGLLRVDALNLIARRLRSQGPLGTFRRYWQRARYQRQGLPVYLMIEPASVCNLRCPYCSVLQTSEKVETGVMDLQSPYKDLLIDQIVSRQGLLSPANGPVLPGRAPDEPPFRRDGRPRQVQGADPWVPPPTRCCSLKDETRAAILDSGLDVLIVSFDGASKESYEAHRVGAVFEKVVEAGHRVPGPGEERPGGSKNP